jgi:hypothetical protein
MCLPQTDTESLTDVPGLADCCALTRLSTDGNVNISSLTDIYVLASDRHRKSYRRSGSRLSLEEYVLIYVYTRNNANRTGTLHDNKTPCQTNPGNIATTLWLPGIHAEHFVLHQHMILRLVTSSSALGKGNAAIMQQPCQQSPHIFGMQGRS